MFNVFMYPLRFLTIPSNERHLIGHQFVAIVTNYAGNILVRFPFLWHMFAYICKVSFILFCFYVFGCRDGSQLQYAGSSLRAQTLSLVVHGLSCSREMWDFSSPNSIPGIARQILNHEPPGKSLYGKFLLTQPPGERS